MGTIKKINAAFKVCSGYYLSGFLCVLFQSSVLADGFPDTRFKALLDARVALTDDELGWLDEGLGKTRFGGDKNAQDQIRYTVAEASAIVNSRFSLSTAGKLHLKADPEQTHNIDLVEGFISYRPVSTSATQIKARAGIFFPPISLENDGLAWTSPYSISTSAINSWIGEELRTLGVEATLTHRIEDDKYSFTAALYRANDPTGSLLAWRGWALHDRKSGWSDRLSLPPLPSIESGGSIEVQASWVEPFHEIDRRTGYYAAFDWKRMHIAQLKIMRYDNRADEEAFDGDQYAWHTRFTAIGGHYEFVNGIELLAQVLKGDSLMGRIPSGALVVAIDFQAAYLLLSKVIKKHRLSFRYDRFSVDDFDASVDDNNAEEGKSLSLAYSYKVSRSQRLFIEALHINSDHESRIDLGLLVAAKENTLQFSYRFVF